MKKFTFIFELFDKKLKIEIFDKTRDGAQQQLNKKILSKVKYNSVTEEPQKEKKRPDTFDEGVKDVAKDLPNKERKPVWLELKNKQPMDQWSEERKEHYSNFLSLKNKLKKVLND